MKPDRDLRAAAIGLMATVAAVGIVRGLMPGPAEATLAAPSPSPVLVRPQTSSADPAEPPGTLYLNSRGQAQPATPATDRDGYPVRPGIDPARGRPRSGAALQPRE